ncbi:hypothetical protein PBRA_006558 [Plasmodiophora brassicae]|uniref:Uncharacterized protein n=1 Tax=Plasmodiophora brassicae TaxID=37360 RepID=A0A0G4ITF8_PLABS|nr:hypothetical protein PBRA_006558 [Plasmodiophora brassicae]
MTRVAALTLTLNVAAFFVALFSVGAGLHVLSPNGTAVASFATNRFQFASNAFDVTGPVYVVTTQEMALETLSDAAAGRIVVLLDPVTAHLQQWADLCERRSCLALIRAGGVGFNDGYSGWAFWVHSRPFTSLPMVDMNIFAGVAMLKVMQAANTTTIRIGSGPDLDAVNPFAVNVAFDPFSVAVQNTAFFIAALNFLLALKRLASFVLDQNGKLRAPPRWPAGVIVAELYSSLGISAYASRFGSTAYLPFTYLSSALVGFAMHDTLHAGMVLSRTHRIVLGVVQAFVFLIVAADQLATVVATATLKDFLNTSIFSVMYLCMDLPMALGFIKYGLAVSKQLLKTRSLTGAEQHRRQVFANRVKLSGIVGLVTLTSQLAFALWFSVSGWAYMNLYALCSIFYAVQGILHLSAFKPKPSIVDKYVGFSTVRTETKASKSERNPFAGTPSSPQVVRMSSLQPTHQPATQTPAQADVVEAGAVSSAL